MDGCKYFNIVESALRSIRGTADRELPTNGTIGNKPKTEILLELDEAIEHTMQMHNELHEEMLMSLLGPAMKRPNIRPMQN